MDAKDALEFGSIAEMCFDLDQNFVRTNPAEIISNRHIFVARQADISIDRNTADSFKLSRSPLEGGIDPSLAERASAIHDRLVLKARKY